MAEQHSNSTNALEPWASLDGKIVMVTGASSGIGREFCLDLAKAGCRIVAAARRADRLRTLCEEINQLDSSGVRAVAVELDVSAKGSVIQESVGKAWSAFGSIHVLINNAGVRGTSGKESILVEHLRNNWSTLGSIKSLLEHEDRMEKLQYAFWKLWSNSRRVEEKHDRVF